MGVDVWKRVAAESFAPFATQEFNDNDSSMLFICRYLTLLHEVMEGSKRAAEQPSARALQQPRVEAMIRFAELQKQFLTKPPTLTSTIGKDNYSLADRFMDFEKEQGEPVYTKLLNEYIVELQGEICIGGVSVCAVHNKIIKEGDPASIFELIVRDTCVARTLAGCKLLLDSMPTEPRNADNDMVTDDSMPYNRSMEALDHVVKASELTAFKLLGAATADGEGVADGVVVSCGAEGVLGSTVRR